MLAEFIAKNREKIVQVWLAKVRPTVGARARSADELLDDLTSFLDELIEALRRARDPATAACDRAIVSDVAPRHGAQRFRIGFDIGEVVHDYGSVCHAVTEAAFDANEEIEICEFQVLNQALDVAIAEAVTEYVRQRDAVDEKREIERLGFIAHELRNTLSTATLSFQAMRSGQLSTGGRTFDVLGRALARQKELIAKLMSDVRLRSGTLQRQHLRLGQFLEEIEVAASLDAQVKRIQLSLQIDPRVQLDADRFLLTSVVSNLMSNAIKYTPEDGHIVLRGRALDGEVMIEVEDECGGLPEGKSEQLFEPFVQAGADRSGLGLGLSIARQCVEAHGGQISVRNLPGHGCVFAIRLPGAAC